MKGDKLSPKQEKFAREYLKDFHTTNAALRAGYSPKSATAQGSRLLSKANVLEIIEKGKQKQIIKCEVSQEYVLKGFLKIAERGLDESNWEPKSANKALEMLGKHLGMWVEKNETKLTGELTIQTLLEARKRINFAPSLDAEFIEKERCRDDPALSD
jgi:phage terminase small subunit